jgi:hypothetical protein
VNVEQIARIAHEANRAYCLSIGDESQWPWDIAADWQRDSAICGVMATLTSNGGPAEQHRNWMAHKEADGWKYGPVKDPGKKEHPCMVPYHELPVEQRAKDHLFQGVVRALYNAHGGRVEGTPEQMEAIRAAQRRDGRPIDTGLCS